MRIAILGSSSSIYGSVKKAHSVFGGHEIFEFSRSPLTKSGKQQGSRPAKLDDFLHSTDVFDVLLNFIGSGDPKLPKAQERELSSAMEFWDSVVVGKMRRLRIRNYWHMSSGIAGRQGTEDTPGTYSATKRALESEHGESGLPIVDIRVYGFADRSAHFVPGSLIGDIRSTIDIGGTLRVDSADIVRDYCGASELSQMFTILLEQRECNGIVELESQAPLRKFDLLDELQRQGQLDYEIVSQTQSTMTGEKLHYTPSGEHRLNNFKPLRTSMKVVMDALGLEH